MADVLAPIMNVLTSPLFWIIVLLAVVGMLIVFMLSKKKKEFNFQKYFKKYVFEQEKLNPVWKKTLFDTWRLYKGDRGIGVIQKWSIVNDIATMVIKPVLFTYKKLLIPNPFSKEVVIAETDHIEINHGQKSVTLNDKITVHSLYGIYYTYDPLTKKQELKTINRLKEIYWQNSFDSLSSAFAKSMQDVVKLNPEWTHEGQMFDKRTELEQAKRKTFLEELKKG